MPGPKLDWLLVLVPVSIVAKVFTDNELAIFFTSALAIVPLAGLIGRATDQLALHAGPRIGGRRGLQARAAGVLPSASDDELGG